MASIDIIKCTEKEKNLLRSSWSDDFEALYEIGTQIYIHIFNAAPEVRQIFTYIAAYPIGDLTWQDRKEFRCQALKFVQQLAQAVSCLTVGGEAAESFDRSLELLGARHRRFASRGFHTGMWDVFEMAVADVMGERMKKSQKLSEGDRALAVAVWKRLAKHIIYKMKEGFEDPKITV